MSIQPGPDTKNRPQTLGQLKAQGYRPRTVKEELRDNLIAKIKAGAELFPGIVGYDKTVVPQLENALLSRHDFILLGLRGQAKTRILRALTTLLDEWLPVIPDSEINDDPIAPLSAFGQQRVKARAIRCRCAGCRARRATSRSWRHRT